MPDNIQIEPVPFKEAAEIIRGRPAVDQKVFKQMIPEIRARTFLISGIEDMKVAQEIRDLVAELPLGGDWDALRQQITTKLLGPGGVPWMDEESAGKRATLLLRHHGFQAYAAENHHKLVELSDAFPYWKYLSMGDDRVRDSHAKLHGLILPWNHAFWSDHYPPWDWGCRCLVIAISPGTYETVVKEGRVAGQMQLTGRIDGDFEIKSRGWTLPDSGLKYLEMTGRLDEGIGSTIDVSSPLQRAIKIGPSEARAAYQWNPGDLRMSVSELHERYGKTIEQKEVFDAFYRNMQAATFSGRDGLDRSVWDWCLSADIEREARSLVEKAGAKTNELLAVMDYRTGTLIADISGSSDRVRYMDHAKQALFDGRSTAMIHNHLEPGVPSPADMAVLYRCNPTVKTIAVVDPGGKIHIVSAKMSPSRASNLRMAKLLDEHMKQMDAGTITHREWEEIFYRLIRTGRLQYESK